MEFVYPQINEYHSHQTQTFLFEVPDSIFSSSDEHDHVCYGSNCSFCLENAEIDTSPEESGYAAVNHYSEPRGRFS